MKTKSSDKQLVDKTIRDFLVNDINYSFELRVKTEYTKVCIINELASFVSRDNISFIDNDDTPDQIKVVIAKLFADDANLVIGKLLSSTSILGSYTILGFTYDYTPRESISESNQSITTITLKV